MPEEFPPPLCIINLIFELPLKFEIRKHDPSFAHQINIPLLGKTLQQVSIQVVTYNEKSKSKGNELVAARGHLVVFHRLIFFFLSSNLARNILEETCTHLNRRERQRNGAGTLQQRCKMQKMDGKKKVSNLVGFHWFS